MQELLVLDFVLHQLQELHPRAVIAAVMIALKASFPSFAIDSSSKLRYGEHQLPR